MILLWHSVPFIRRRNNLSRLIGKYKMQPIDCIHYYFLDSLTFAFTFTITLYFLLLYTIPNRNPLQFDVFSIAMIFCQLLFNLLDERTDAAFRQQLLESNYDLDTWLARELSSTIRPVGLDDALSYLVERKGM